MFVPDSSTPISTGTVPDFGPRNLDTGPSAAAEAATPVTFPKPAYVSQDTQEPIYTPREATISKAIWGGMLQTAWASALMANDMPAFNNQPNYDASVDIDKLQALTGYEMDHEDRDYLLRSRSPEEFQYRNFQLSTKAEGLQDMAARPFVGMVGAAVDVDVVLGYGIGLGAKAAKLSKLNTMTALTAGTAGGTAGTYAYAYDNAPVNAVDAAIHVGLSSSLAFLYGSGFKYNKPIEGYNADNPNAFNVGASTEVPSTTPDVPPAPLETPPSTNPLEGITPVDVAPKTEPSKVKSKGKTRTKIRAGRKAARKAANKRVVDAPEQATDDDLLEAIDDWDDEDFINLD